MASHIHTHHYLRPLRPLRPLAQSQAPPPSSVAPFNQETLMQRLQALIEGVRESWTYAIFWQPSDEWYDISGPSVLGWGEGFYNPEWDEGKVKPKRTTSLVEQEYRKKMLRDLYSLICGSDTSADDIVDREVVDTEWFFLVSMTQNFVNGGGLPGQAFFLTNPIWVAGRDRLAASSCQRASQGQVFGLETMVCVPTANGVVELGSTELIFQSSDLMNKVRVLFDFSNLEAAEPIACSNVDSKFTTDYTSKFTTNEAAEPIACSNVDSKFTTDYTSKFTTNEKFKSREDLIEWACKVGRSNGFGIVTLRSDNGGKGNKRPRFTLGCKKSGKYDSRPPKKEIKNKDRRHSRTKKCDCPFQLKGKKLVTYWELTVVKGMHNHPVDYSEVGRSFLGGLSSSKEKHDVRPMKKLNRLRKDNEGHETATSSQCLREVESGRSEMQPLLSKLSSVNERMKRRRLSKNMNTSTHSAVPSSEIIVESTQRNSTTCGPPIFHSKQGWQLKEKVYCIPLKFLGVCPIVMRPYILYIEDVASDGHCGFRAVASLLGNNNEDGWIRVRNDLMKELEFNSAQYTQLFMSEKRVNKLHHALAYSNSGTTCLDQKEHWMTMPDMGHIIASCYNVVLMLFSSAQCLTFFPLRTVPLLLSSPKEIAIGFVNEHFVQVFLKQGHPMPLIAEDWKRYNEHKQSFIEEWTTPYNARIKNFTDLQPDIYLEKSLIIVDT